MPEVKMNDLNIHYEVDDFRSPWEASEMIWIQHGFGRSGASSGFTGFLRCAGAIAFYGWI